MGLSLLQLKSLWLYTSLVFMYLCTHGHKSQLENEFLTICIYLFRYSVVTYKNGPLFVLQQKSLW